MWYKLSIQKDSFKVRSYTSLEEVHVSLHISTTCDKTFKEVIPSFLVDFEEERKFPLVDGLYKVVFKKIHAGTVLETEEIIFPNYNMLLTSIINDIEKVVCNCECKECEDNCFDNQEDVLGLFLRAFSYYTLTKQYYGKFFESVSTCLQCDILDISNCAMASQNVLGSSETKELLKKILGTFYLSFYFANYYNIEDKEVINKKFKFEKLSKCIKTTQANIECIKNKIESMATVTMINTAYVNQPPTTVGNISIEQPNKTNTTYTVAHFTTATTPAYSDPENDPINAIRVDTLPAAGQLQFDSSPVIVGQIILATDITAGKFRYVAPDQATVNNTTWTYSARDSGSMTFKS